MATCRICLHQFKTLRFDTGRIAICGRCVSTLNTSPEVAATAQERIGELLRGGMMRNANRELASPEEWKRRRAVARLENFDEHYQRALPDWLNKLLKDPKNNTRDFKIMRAHRRGLLHFDRPKGRGYPPRWPDVASRIREQDGYRCTRCRIESCALDVHHIVYVSAFGTHQQSNLVTLCRACHEAEHGRSFDSGEATGDSAPLNWSRLGRFAKRHPIRSWRARRRVPPELAPRPRN